MDEINTSEDDSARPSDAPSREFGWLADWALTWATIGVVVSSFCWVLSDFDGLWDADSYFHVRCAQQLYEHGIQKQFPQATVSTWSEHYSDKDFLFHVFLIPFVRTGDLFESGRWALPVLNLIVFATLAYAFRELGVRFGALWILLLVSTTKYHVGNFLPVRPHLLGFALIILESVFLVRNRWKPLFIVCALHVLTHSSFVLGPALLVAKWVSCYLRRESCPVAVPIAVFGGLIGATLLHPYFPNNVLIAYQQVVEVAGNVWSQNAPIPSDLFGPELRPIRMEVLFQGLAAWLPALIGVSAFLLTRGADRMSAETLTLALFSLGFLALTTKTAKFFDLFAVECALLSGVLWTELAAGRPLKELLRAHPRPTWAAMGLLAGCLVFGQLMINPVKLRGLVSQQLSASACRPAVEYLERMADPDDVIYHSFWRDFSPLYGFRPEGRYIVALDPVFMYAHDPIRFRLMLSAYRGTAADVAHIISQDFGARWVFVTKAPWDYSFRVQMKESGRLRRVFEDDYGEVWKLID